MSQARATFTVSISLCTFDHTEALSILQSPTGMAVGDEMGQFYRGAIIGNFIITAGFIGVVYIAAFVIHHYQLKMATDSQSTFSHELVMLKFPGVVLVPVSILWEGTLMSAVALMRHGGTPGLDIFLGSVAWLAAAVCLVGAAILLTIRFAATPVINLDQSQSLILAFIEGSQKWRDLDPGSNFKRRFACIFSTFRSGMHLFPVYDFSSRPRAQCLMAFDHHRAPIATVL